MTEYAVIVTCNQGGEKFKNAWTRCDYIGSSYRKAKEAYDCMLSQFNSEFIIEKLDYGETRMSGIYAKHSTCPGAYFVELHCMKH